jgi:predicted metal-dependent hydrolase
MDKVKGHAPWIIAECQKKKNPPNTEDDQTQQEATCTYLGKNYKVKVIQNEDKEVPTVKLVRGKLEIEMKDVTQEGMITALQGWYTKKILDKVKEKQKIFQSYFKRMPQQIDISAIGKQLYILEGDTLHIHGVVAKGPIQVLEYIMVLAFCEYNKMLLTDTSLAPLLEGEEQAKVWLSLNGYV